MSVAEIRRRTMAEDLMLMMEVFPLELCVVALEKNRDDMQYSANWLLEKGFQELELWTRQTIDISKKLQDDKDKVVSFIPPIY